MIIPETALVYIILQVFDAYMVVNIILATLKYTLKIFNPVGMDTVACAVLPDRIHSLASAAHFNLAYFPKTHRTKYYNTKIGFTYSKCFKVSS